MLLSVVMAVYNCEQYVDDAVASIVAQRYDNWELIIVNDGSTDKTGALLEKWVRQDSRITVLHQSRSGTCGPPRNLGLGKVTGDIVAIIDGDDVTHPERFSRLIQVFNEDAHVDAVYHDYVRFETERPTFSEPPTQRVTGYIEKAVNFGALSVVAPGRYRSTGRFRAFLASHGTGMTQGSLAFRRWMLDGVGPEVFRADLPTFQDVEFYLRLSKRGVFLFLDEVLFAYRSTPGSNLNSVKEQEHVDRIFRVKAPALLEVERELPSAELKVLREALAEGWRSIGWRAARAGCESIALKCYTQSMRLTRRPRNFADSAYEVARLLSRWILSRIQQRQSSSL